MYIHIYIEIDRYMPYKDILWVAIRKAFHYNGILSYGMLGILAYLKLWFKALGLGAAIPADDNSSLSHTTTSSRKQPKSNRTTCKTTDSMCSLDLKNGL